MPYDPREARAAYESRDTNRPGWDGMDVWEPGWYAARVLEVDETAVSRQGNEMLVVRFGLVRADERQKELTKRFVIDAGVHPTARRIALERLGELADASGRELPAEWVGADVMVRLKYDARGRYRTDEDGRRWELENDIGGFRPVGRKERAARDTHGDEDAARVLEKEPAPPEDEDDLPF